MITGEVRENREATIQLSLRGPRGRTAEVESVIDTGFTDYLTLARDTVEHLALRYRESMAFELADGELAMFDLYGCQVSWHGSIRDVLVAVADGGPLVGMALLGGSRLEIDVISGGRVSITPLR